MFIVDSKVSKSLGASELASLTRAEELRKNYERGWIVDCVNQHEKVPSKYILIFT